MSFTFSNAISSQLAKSPLEGLANSLFSGYEQGQNAKYRAREKEADIFHKQISPLAMLASSPYFSSLHPAQQQQIAGYISNMMNRNGLGGQASPASGGMGGNNGMAGNAGAMNPNPQGGMGGGNEAQNYGAQGEDLVPSNAGEHFTGQYKQSPYTSGTAHRSASGETIYAPTGAAVQHGTNALTESKGLKKAFESYSKLAPKVAGAGGVKREASRWASGLEKTKLPYTQQISEFLGGPKVSNEAAQAETLIAQMSPALTAIGYTPEQINNLLRYYPGESEKNMAERLKNTWPAIQRKLDSYNKNLQEGVKISKKEAGAVKAKTPTGYKEAPKGSILLYNEQGDPFYFPPEKVDYALSKGFTYE
jgi:hypothetical protein